MSGKVGDALADGDSAAAPSHELERVDGFKERLATLCTHEAELEVELSELDVQHAIKLRELAHKEAVENVKAKREAVRAEIKVAESELVAAVNAPVSGGRDPTE